MNEKIYIFGAGMYGRILLKELKNIKTVDVAAFIDNSLDRQGGEN